ncbi:MAG: hypothetical protein IPK96_08945 [Flammeovirgaceae bacterium]|nr:hypothetical protein [Flammeovirgaceae bacterium]
MLTSLRVLLIILYFSSTGLSQFTPVMENNPHLRWQQINTDHFKIVFPKGFEGQAQRMANTFEHIRTPEAKSLGVEPRKISVILQNQSSVSNGFVSITPRRSEFFAMPSQNYNFLGNLDWLDLLATHEYRHIVQFQHANRGFNKALFYLFGANTLAALSYIAVPQWFWEGDAVATETAFTSSGRGRIPNFDLLFRTNLQEGRTFNYNKQYLRSYKHNIPDHYVLGYQMVSYLRKKSGNADVWENITRRAWSVPFAPFTFSNSIKKESGLYVKELYAEMAATLRQEWKEELKKIEVTPFEIIHNRSNKAYTDYKYPFELAKDSILALKSGIGDIEELVLLSGGKEKRLTTPGVINATGMLSVAGNRVVWNEFRYDPRWRMKTYSVIVGYDLKEKKRKFISRNSRYASAALSPDGTKVATIETSTDYLTRLVVLDYETGEVIKFFENPDNDFISMPHWKENGTELIALVTNRSGKALAQFDLSGQQKLVTEFTDENIGYPVPYQNYILFNSPRSSIDNIYALDTRSNQKYQITSSHYGAYNPSVSFNGKYLYYNEQGRDGLNVVKADFDPTLWIPVTEIGAQPTESFQHLVEQEGRPDLLDSIPGAKYPIGKYSPVSHAVNPYGWGAYFTTSLTEVNIGITSRDVLSTTAINAGYLFDLNERTGSWNVGVSYQGLYPILDVNFSSGNRSVNEGDLEYDKVVGTDTTSTTENLTFDWHENTVEGGIRIPLLTTCSRFLSSISLSNYVGFSHITDFVNSIDGGGRIVPTNYPQYIFRDYADNGNLFYNRFNISAYRLLKKSRRDINSKWGQALFVNLYNTPYGGDYSGNQFSFQGQLFFPGLVKHHSFWGYWAYQKTEIADIKASTGEGLDSYLFRNQIPLPRGQSVTRFQNFYSMSANYTLPVWYPDLALGPILNIQRVRLNAFLDYGYGNSVINQNPSSKSYLSTGGEVKFDINIFRLLPQLDIGFRYSYGISPSTVQYEFLIGTLNF